MDDVTGAAAWQTARMYRLAAVVLVLGACKKQEPPAGAPPPTTGSATPAAPRDAAPAGDAAAALPRVDLLRAVATTITVSSQVANPKILPRHLVDRDLGTAWNSRTGELEGAWLRVVVPPGAVIEELRLTAGHTGKGPKQEDYFTMNPRVARIALEPRGGKRVEVALDVGRRDLQAVPIHAQGGLVLRVVAIAPGSKTTWKEIAISELEVWGTPPPGWTPPAAPVAPTVVVEPPPAATSKLFAQACASLDDDTKERAQQREASAAACAELPEPERSQCGVDEPGDPSCEVTAVETPLAPPWRALAEHCEVDDDIYGPARCTILIDNAGKLVTGPKIEVDHKALALTVVEATLEDVIAGGARELVVRYTVEEMDEETSYVTVCEAAKGCAAPLTVGDKAWSASVRFAGGQATLARDTGTPPAGALGKRALAWKP